MSVEAFHLSETLPVVVPVTANPVGTDGGTVSTGAVVVVAVRAAEAAEMLPAVSKARTV